MKAKANTDRLHRAAAWTCVYLALALGGRAVSQDAGNGQNNQDPPPPREGGPNPPPDNAATPSGPVAPESGGPSVGKSGDPATASATESDEEAPTPLAPIEKPETNTPAGPPTMSSFRIITDRNIFNPTRAPRTRFGQRGRVTQRAKPVESFTFVGALIFDQSTVAFFDGTTADAHKAVRLEDTILGAKVSGLTLHNVHLVTPTNEIDLPIGTGMHRELNGVWSKSTEELASVSPSAADSPASSPSGAASDVLKRLMERRQKDLSR